MLEGDRDRVIVAEVTARAWKDEDYRKRLIREPDKVFTEAGLKIPPGAHIKIVENTPTVAYVSIPAADRFAARADAFMASLGRMLPLPAGVEVRMLQCTASQRFIVLPLAPNMDGMSDQDLLALVGGSSAVNSQTNVNDNANVNVTVNSNGGANVTVGVDVAVGAVVFS